jgi:hypothetical protein
MHLSRIIPDTVLWEDWTVDPKAIYLAPDGRLRLKGFESLELLDASFKPLTAVEAAECRDATGWILFRRHPRVEGVLCLCAPERPRC